MNFPRRIVASLSFVFAGVALLAAPATAQTDGAGLRQQYLEDLAAMESKFNELADAMPEGTYDWRPMEGVRSVSEVYMLIAAENWIIPSIYGAAEPEGMEVTPALWSELPQVTGKDEVLEHLAKSFAYAAEAIGSVPDAKMDETISFFGQDRTVQEALYLIMADMHEHLGQAIAYARMNEVVPPWTARQGT